MPVKCDACLKILSDDRVTRDGGTAEGAVVDDAKYEAIDGVLTRVHDDLEFRSRIGLALNVKRVQTWFRFHGPWLPALPPKAQAAPPKPTIDCYAFVSELCDFFAQKSWADEIHLQACAAHRELLREIVRLNGR
jgi:hypothetical protein